MVETTQATGDSAMLDDIQAEALRIIAAAEAQGITLRLLGGLAVLLHSPSASHRGLERKYPDIDFATNSRKSAPVEALFTALGYTPNKAFNLLNGASRLLFYDTARSRQVDIFVGQFEMCHRLPITDRLALEPATLPLAELLLTKLQIVKMNDKDARDICALLLDHPLGTTDDETINQQWIAQVCAEDWGLWKTVMLSLDKIHARAESYDLEPSAGRIIAQRVGALRQIMDNTPKSFKWKTRAMIGERMQWYTVPEEVQRG